jgi:prepilin-type N-terminal cleavage/methylation domain-containing protein
MKTRAQQGGFTIIEIIIAILILTVGLLGLVTTAAVVTRMIGRGQRSAAAAAFAARRLERLRPAACIAAQRVAGSDTLNRGVTWIAMNRWTYTDAGNNTYRVKIWTTSKTVQGRVHVDSTEATIPCN